MRYEPAVLWKVNLGNHYGSAIDVQGEVAYMAGYSPQWAIDPESGEATYWHPGSVVSLNAQTGQMAWQATIQPYGDLGYVQVSDVAAALDGNVYVVGSVHPLNDNASNSYDGFLAKISSSGEVLWSEILDSGFGDSLSSVVIAPDQSIYVGGFTGGSLWSDNPSPQTAYGQRATIAQYIDQGTGATLNAWNLIGEHYKDIVSLEISANGESLYAAGLSRVQNGLITQPYVIKQSVYDAQFDSYWSHRTSYEDNYAQAQYDNNYVALGAEGYGPFSSYGEALYSNYIADETDSLDYWVRFLNDPLSTNHVSDLVVDQSGNLYLYGDSLGSVEGQAPMDGTDLYLAQLSELTGNLNWIQRLGSESDQYAGSMAIGSDGGIVLSGRSIGPVDTLNVDLTTFLAQYSTSGEHLETSLFGSWGMAPSLEPASDGQFFFSDGNSISLIDPSNPQPVPERPALFTYRLLTEESASAQSVTNMEVYAFGDPEDQRRRYYLEISADTGLSGGVGLASVDLSLHFNPDLFADVLADDINLSPSPLSQLQRVSIDNELGLIRFAASSAESILEGGAALGSAIRSNSVLGYIAFDLDDAALTDLLDDEGYLPGTTTRRTESASFSLSANLDETVFTDLDSLREKQVYELSYSVTGVNANAFAVTMNLGQQAGHRLGTQRQISLLDGEIGFTNLIREGDTVASAVSWKNIGDMGITGVDVQAKNIANANVSVLQSFAEIGVGTRFPNGTIYAPYRPSKQVSVAVQATGSAGEVIDATQGLYEIREASGWFDWVGKGSKNLITYQGDLNYDGRVSMKDLAFLNAGATLKSQTGAIAGDVDADHDGDFTIADLEVLDRQWGQSLHSGSKSFVGQTQTLAGETTNVMSWDELSSQGVPNEQSSGMTMGWDNTNFEIQNTIEASGVFEPSQYGSALS